MMKHDGSSAAVEKGFAAHWDFTVEPESLDGGEHRILATNRTTASARRTMNGSDVRSEVRKSRHAMSTILGNGSGDPLLLPESVADRGYALLVEISDNHLMDVRVRAMRSSWEDNFSTTILLHQREYQVGLTRPPSDRFGLWDWAFTIDSPELPGLDDELPVLSISVRGRGWGHDKAFKLAPIAPYLAGRSAMIEDMRRAGA